MKYNRAMSEEQVVDLQWAVMKTTDQIGMYQVMGNMRAVTDLVEHLETLLCAYTDDKYKADLVEINKIKSDMSASSDIGRRSIAKSISYEKTKKKHRALMQLAMRCGFMPLKKTGNTGTR